MSNPNSTQFFRRKTLNSVSIKSDTKTTRNLDAGKRVDTAKIQGHQEKHIGENVKLSTIC